MTHGPATLSDHRRVLLSVANAREVVRAGLGGARLSVRTLDKISCHVHAGELLTLRGTVASGALSLLRALHGTSPRIRAEHHSAPHVQLRRATISASSALGIERGWRDVSQNETRDETRDASDAQPQRNSAGVVTSRGLERRAVSARCLRAPVVYLLRVRSLQPGAEAIAEPLVEDAVKERSAWHEWARQVRDAGGAVVLAVQAPFAALSQIQTRPTMRGARLIPTSVRERVNVRADNIRTLTLHAGQFISADPNDGLPC